MRVGFATINEFDYGNVGIGSFSTGTGNTASGAYSTAMGSHNLASGAASISLGAFSVSSGNYSFSVILTLSVLVEHPTILLPPVPPTIR